MRELPESKSEDRGLALIKDRHLKIYSAGISTGGRGEVQMARVNKCRSIVATTIDVAGANFTRAYVESAGMQNQIDVRLEDVSEPLPYTNHTFDFVYSRLALHYLRPADLKNALRDLHRILNKAGKFFCVVRSAQGRNMVASTVTYDPISHTTSGRDHEGRKISAGRYLHTVDSISNFISNAGFTIESTAAYDEVLYKNYERSMEPAKDRVIEVVANKS